MDIKIVINGKEYPVEQALFRRILVSASGNFEKLKRLEGTQFPTVDRQSLNLIRELQFRHKELI